MKKNLIFVLFLALNAYSQEEVKVDDNQFRLNILNPGLTFEKGIGKTETLCLDTNIAWTFTTSTKTGIALTPFGRLQFREYYNLEKRVSKNKNILKNSGNYIALNTSYYFKSINDNDFVYLDDGFNIGAAWGLQRTYKSGLNINLNTGLAYNFSNRREKSIHPLINFTIGWVFF